MEPDPTSDAETEAPSRFHFYLGLIVLTSSYTVSLLVLRFLLAP